MRILLDESCVVIVLARILAIALFTAGLRAIKGAFLHAAE